MEELTTSRQFWQQRASALALRINAAAWLGRMAPATFFVACPFAIAWYALRRVEIPLAASILAFAVALILAAVACWWRSRRDFFAADDARVFLESQLRLDTRLTVAAANLTQWPDAPPTLPAVVRWRVGVPAIWLGAAVVILIGAIAIPVSHDRVAVHFSGPPPALMQTDAMLSALRQMNVADPAAVEQLAERAAELARRPSDEQYSHSALEAADALRNQAAAAAAELARKLDSAAAAMQQSNGDPDMKGAAGRLSAALSGLRDGALPANRKLLGNLPGNATDLGNLSAAQRSQLAQQLSGAAKGLNGISGAAGANAPMATPDPNAVSEWETGTGSGGPGGGGGTAPLALSSQASDAGQGNAEAVSDNALNRVALGDKLGTTAGAHDVDPTRMQVPGSAGAVAAPASGGDAVWVNRLTPSERAALKDFFK